MARHYAPRVPLFVRTAKQITKERALGDAVITRTDRGGAPNTIALPADPHGYAAGLYAAMREADSLPGVTRILVEEPPHGARWDAIHDRLRRASATAL